MKKCPYCAEEIQDEAIVCRYCNNDLMDIQNRKEASMHKKQGIEKEGAGFWAMYKHGLGFTALLWVVRLIANLIGMDYSMAWGDVIVGPIVILLGNFFMGLPIVWMSRKITKGQRNFSFLALVFYFAIVIGIMWIISTI